MGEARRAPGGKRLATSVTAAVVALMAIPAWARTVWVRRAPSLDAIASASRAPFAFRPRRFASSPSHPPTARARDTTPITYGAASRPGQTPATMSASASPSPPATVPASSEARSTTTPLSTRPIPVLLRPQGALRVDAVRRRRGHLDHRPRRRREPSCGASSDAYTLFLFPSDEASETLTMGAGRHAWARYPAGGGRWRQTGAERAAAAARRAVPIAASYFTTGHDFEGADGADGAEEVPMRVPPLPGVSPSGAALLSFSLVNAAPEEGHTYSWRFEEDFEKPLVSHLVAALAPLVDARVEAQVLYHSPSRAATEARRDASTGEFKLSADDARRFVDGDWNLDTSPAQLRVTPVHFVAYVPAANTCPLTVSLADGSPSPSNGFVVPGWGGVVAWNPPTCRGGAKTEESAETEETETEETETDTEETVAVSRRVAYLDASDATTVTSASSRSFARRTGFRRVADGEDEENIPGWWFDRCPRARRVSRGGRWTCWCVVARWRRCARRRTRCRPWRATRNIPSSACPRARRTRRGGASRRRRRARCRRGGSRGGRRRRRADAHVAAESAFFHPDIISLLYFPAEYTLAVYVPLFLPTAFPVLVGLMWDVRFFVRRRRCAAAFRERRDTKVE